MAIKFQVGWDSEGASEGISGLNTEANITSILTGTKQLVVRTDATKGVLLSMAQGSIAGNVWVIKGFHQDTQSSNNPRDKERSNNLHFNVKLGIDDRTHHVYVAPMGTGGYRVREIT